jgi:hypothetical protein
MKGTTMKKLFFVTFIIIAFGTQSSRGFGQDSLSSSLAQGCGDIAPMTVPWTLLAQFEGECTLDKVTQVTVAGIERNTIWMKNCQLPISEIDADAIKRNTHGNARKDQAITLNPSFIVDSFYAFGKNERHQCVFELAQKLAQNNQKVSVKWDVYAGDGAYASDLHFFQLQ